MPGRYTEDKFKDAASALASLSFRELDLWAEQVEEKPFDPPHNTKTGR